MDLNEVVLAYRSDLAGKCNIQFAKETFDEVRNSDSFKMGVVL
jgi:hypothetical protein